MKFHVNLVYKSVAFRVTEIRTGEKEFLCQNLGKSEPKVKVRNKIVFHYSEKAHRRG